MRKKVIIKIGGRAFESQQNYLALSRSIIQATSHDFIILHGGGAEISHALQAVNRKPEFVDGLRVTTAEDMEIVERVLSEEVNAKISTFLTQGGVKCRRMSGRTQGLFVTEPLRKNGRDLGFVGRIVKINTEPLIAATCEKRVPVISPVSSDASGTSYNVNADSAASALAVAIKSDHLIYFTDVPGVLVAGEVIHDLNVRQAQSLIAAGDIRDGMIAKLESIAEALRNGVQRVHIAQWQGDNTLEQILSTESKLGTTIQL